MRGITVHQAKVIEDSMEELIELLIPQLNKAICFSYKIQSSLDRNEAIVLLSHAPLLDRIDIFTFAIVKKHLYDVIVGQFEKEKSYKVINGDMFESLLRESYPEWRITFNYTSPIAGVKNIESILFTVA
jgi:hypothetical protein